MGVKGQFLHIYIHQIEVYFKINLKCCGFLNLIKMLLDDINRIHLSGFMFYNKTNYTKESYTLSIKRRTNLVN